MTIKEYLEKIVEIRLSPVNKGDSSSLETMMSTMEIWNCGACRGYAIIAMEEAGVDTETIKKVVGSMSRIFNTVSTDEAERRYNCSDY